MGQQHQQISDILKYPVKQIRILSSRPGHLLLAIWYLLVCSFSVYLYFPPFFKLFNSDSAIQVVIANDFTLPRDFYYWGQNRLGSLLPAIAYLLVQITGMHALYACGIVLYACLLIPTLIITGQVKNFWLKAAFFTLIFLPIKEYNFLIWLGHPYGMQYFCGVICIAFFLKLNKYLQKRETVPKPYLFSILGALFLFNVFFFLGIWVSEFNFVLILVPVFFMIWHRRIYFKAPVKKYFFMVIVVQIVLAIAGFKIYEYVKSTAQDDPGYNTSFFWNMPEIIKQFGFMKNAFDHVLQPRFSTQTMADYTLIGLIVFLILMRKKIRPFPLKKLATSLFILSALSFVLLFFSRWNLRSEYCIRYYAPIYPMVTAALFLYYDQAMGWRYLQPLIFLLIAFNCFGFTCFEVLPLKGESLVKKYGDFRKLPEGTLIADYWDVYLISSLATQIHPLPFDDQSVRNYMMHDELLQKENFYFLNNETAREHHLGDTIRQFGVTFKSTPKKYQLKSGEVLLYKKLVK